MGCGRRLSIEEAGRVLEMRRLELWRCSWRLLRSCFGLMMSSFGRSSSSSSSDARPWQCLTWQGSHRYDFREAYLADAEGRLAGAMQALQVGRLFKSDWVLMQSRQRLPRVSSILRDFMSFRYDPTALPGSCRSVIPLLVKPLIMGRV
ncbi:unnamed protein product [Sphagnum troendelagicum]